MNLDTFGNSGFIWLTSRVKKTFSFTLCPLVTSCLLDKFIFSFCLVSFPAHHACSPWVCRNAHLPGQRETCSPPSFQCSVLVQVWAAGLMPISTLAASSQLSLGTMQALALGDAWKLLVLVLSANRGGKWRFYPVLLIIPTWFHFPCKLREKSH